MLKTMLMMAALATAAAGAGAQTYRPDFDPSRLKGPRTGTPNEVMVLGTPHLRQLPPSFQPEHVAPLVERLARWHPQVIAIETLSGAQCDQLRRYPARYKDTVETYCWDTAPARAATGLNVPAASEEAERLLTAWPAAPTAAQRRRLAAVFLASGDRFSALVQWLRLPAAERRAGDGLDATLVTLLDGLKSRRGEDALIAVPLAVRLGLERVWPMDDHSADIMIADEAGYGAALQRMWDNPAGHLRKTEYERLFAGLGSADGLLAVYRGLNAHGSARPVYHSDFGAALEERSPEGFGRGYLTFWEVRNLRMAANIREAVGGAARGVGGASRPGGRALVIVGASHKGYLEAYLHQMHDVRLVGTDVVLR